MLTQNIIRMQINKLVNGLTGRHKQAAIIKMLNKSTGKLVKNKTKRERKNSCRHVDTPSNQKTTTCIFVAHYTMIIFNLYLLISFY